MSSEPLIKRYAPKQVSDIIGQSAALKSILSFLYNFPNEKTILLFGPPGTGKTSSVKAIASQMKYELIELNASDRRNKESILEVLLPASQQASIFGGKKIILVDEIDNLSGMQDRGGAQAVTEVIEKTRFPIILIANDPFSEKLKSIRKATKTIEFHPVVPEAMVAKLISICELEGIKYEDKAIASIVSASKGDIRAAINDLEMFSTTKKLTFSDIKNSEREREESLNNVLREILCQRDSTHALEKLDLMDEEYDLLMLYLDENLQRVYDNKSLACAYRKISLADRFKERIVKRQHWRFLVYIRALLGCGVTIAKEACRGYFEPKQPSLMLKMWQRNMRRAKTKAMLELLAPKLHSSIKQLEKDFLPYYNFACEHKNTFIIDN